MTRPGSSQRAGVLVTALMATLLNTSALDAQDHSHAMASGPPTSSDSLAVVKAVESYADALQRGDSSAALALLAPDAVILEAGGIETREEYRSHHLPGDIQFTRAVPGKSGPISVTVRGDVAWAWSTSVREGEFRGRPINSAGAELMVLARLDGGWKIAAIHWSSRARKP